MHRLIPYVRLRDHPDPDFNEFTYGDVGARGRSLKNGIRQGDYVFFHTGNGGRKFIVAYFVADRVLEASAACEMK